MHIFRISIIFFFLLFFNENTVFSQQKEIPKENVQNTSISKKISIAELNKLEKLRNKKVVSLGIVLVIILFFLFYFFYQNNKLKQKIKRKDLKQKILLNVINSGIDTQEIERKKIASFLHDNINSLLSSVGLHLNTFTTQNSIQSEEIQKAKAILAEAHDLLRDISHDLVPSLLVRFGLIYALEDLCEKTSNRTLNFDFTCSISSNKRYTEKFEMKIYFIISELFNNIIKHSKATNAQLILSETGNNFIIKVQDNGLGFNARKTDEYEGFGLNRIRARIKKFKGSFDIVSKMNQGTTIKIKIPIPH
ncbi:Histidine kinase [Flavobacterium resistens]|uniref:histidine kinase n=1 Tax=Flavobacterium resistens TaxID=443612 RepID=A0A521DHE5_9FLAO|nr:ATP-binding protein [Flavobacterium resistens]MRX68678.1 histidine kinase [Flavobacterium resistens]SMO70551.1 Histidine kinase [Flavobacterium resistens]